MNTEQMRAHANPPNEVPYRKCRALLREAADRIDALEGALRLITTAKANGDDEQGRIIEARAFLAEDTP